MAIFTRSLFLGLILIPVIRADLMGQCTSDMFLSSGTGDLIRVDGNLSDNQLGQAAGYWSACSAYGVGFPSFTTANVSADIQVAVDYHGGANSVCGQVTHTSPTSMLVELWDQGLTTTGQPYDCNVTDTLAHELGHVLDLNNSTCSGHLMGPAPLAYVNGRLTAGTRSVASDECMTVNDRWTTSTERNGGGGGGGGGPICI